MANIILKATGMICVTLVARDLAVKDQYMYAMILETIGMVIIYIACNIF